MHMVEWLLSHRGVNKMYSRETMINIVRSAILYKVMMKSIIIKHYSPIDRESGTDS